MDQKKREGMQIKVAMREKAMILKELENGKIDMVKEFDEKMLDLKGHIDALIALSCSTAKHHQTS